MYIMQIKVSKDFKNCSQLAFSIDFNFYSTISIHIYRSAHSITWIFDVYSKNKIKAVRKDCFLFPRKISNENEQIVQQIVWS